MQQQITIQHQPILLDIHTTTKSKWPKGNATKTETKLTQAGLIFSQINSAALYSHSAQKIQQKHISLSFSPENIAETYS